MDFQWNLSTRPWHSWSHFRDSFVAHRRQHISQVPLHALLSIFIKAIRCTLVPFHINGMVIEVRTSVEPPIWHVRISSRSKL